MFDPEAFLSEQTEQEFETDFTPVDVGDYTSEIKKLEVSPPKEAGQSPILIVFHQIQDKGEWQNRNVRQSIFLDVTGQGALEDGPNKNVNLGRLRKAVRQESGPWNPNMLLGAACMINVAHRAGTGTYEGRVFDEVKAVTSL